MYNHEFEKPKARAFNTLWPAVATSKRANDRYREYLESRSLDFETAYLAGWYPSYMDCLRVVIPCQSLKAGHAYYQARAIDGEVKLRYASPPGARNGALCLVGSTLDSSLDIPVTAVVEGPMCALALAGLGIDSAATMGICPDVQARAHLLMILKQRNHRAVIIFDNEDEAQAQAAGVSLMLSSAGILSTVICLNKKDVAASSIADRKALVSRISSWAT